MLKGESFLDRTTFVVSILLKMLTPTLYSLARLEKYCKARIKKNPQAYSPRWFLAEVYKDYQKNEEAKKEYEEIICLGYMSEKDWLNFGEVLYRLKDYQGVIATLAPIIGKYPKHKNANWYLGKSYMKKEEYQKAVVYLEGAIIGSKQYEDYWSLGYCYDLLGNLGKAEEAYIKALSIKPDSEELKKNLMLIYIKKGQSFLNSDLKEAELYFKKALDIIPDDPNAIEMLNEIEQMKN